MIPEMKINFIFNYSSNFLCTCCCAKVSAVLIKGLQIYFKKHNPCLIQKKRKKTSETSFLIGDSMKNCIMTCQWRTISELKRKGSFWTVLIGRVGKWKVCGYLSFCLPVKSSWCYNMPVHFPIQTKGTCNLSLDRHRAKIHAYFRNSLSASSNFFISGISWAKRKHFCRGKVLLTAPPQIWTIIFHGSGSCTHSSHHTHTEKDLNKQFSHSEKHTPMTEEKSQIASQVNCIQKDSKFIFTELPALHRPWAEEARAGWEVGDTAWKATTSRSNPPLSQPGAFQALIMWLTGSCSRLCAELVAELRADTRHSSMEIFLGTWMSQASKAFKYNRKCSTGSGLSTSVSIMYVDICTLPFLRQIKHFLP